MPTISFHKNRPSLEVAEGENLMKTLLDAGIPVASSCAGEGICAKCKIIVIEGFNNLSSETELESFLKSRNKLPENMRISCQTKVVGNITIDATYW